MKGRVKETEKGRVNTSETDRNTDKETCIDERVHSSYLQINRE